MKFKSKIIIFPTDTVYGLGCSIHDYDGLNKIYNIKKRDINKPISVLCASLGQLKQIVILNEKITKITDVFWPGPLTLIIPTHPDYYNKTKEKKIGIRIPNHLLALKILKKEGPLRVTSVNISGEEPLYDYTEIKKHFGDKVDFIYKNNDFFSNISSTVVDTTTENWKLIREGEISFEKIQKIINS
ncbi:L-threonylcarbamoyladenylate synthase ['Camptotheca acuminata' phytoplasma]|uniref:L-threonylcarbamoyladenylate synthase n=1 Tax='Camptotheca acuminata' phytoplasma TaxID=3239192 RepID=UPI00351A4DB9